MPSLRERSLLKEVDKFTPWKEGDPHVLITTWWMKSKIKKEKSATNKKVQGEREQENQEQGQEGWKQSQDWFHQIFLEILCVS